ncbi:hypothetical protein M407DRAFT_25421 [Tulasnella calospora MUT 4182]|uniref:F-box domain-containing protein n=1 Tax=Tulasnella calospora MUT 4182 TaxID=1051891 RepID=A0A0C3LUX0_9AGAM|nr:hypothetical protein M407DRAFT_25421 [Tulasnella calospora MUT 4182]
MNRNINSLPTEILDEIFFLVIDRQSARSDRCRLILVCRLWKEYVEGSALLWADISAWDSLAYTRRALERSKASVINIHYPARSNRRTIGLESFMAEAGPHIARWRSLTLSLQGSPQSCERALSPLITAQAPRLERLKLFWADRNRSIPRSVVTLFNGAPAPSTLKYLTLQRVQLAFEPLSLSGLVALDFTGIPILSTPQLLEILRNSPSLETLDLCRNSGLLGTGSQLSATPPIVLAKLNALTLEWTDHEGANCILSTIRIPNRRRVCIRAEISGASAWSVLFTPTIAHILRPTTPSPDPGFSNIKVEVEASDICRIQARGMELELDVDGGDQIAGVLGWLAEGLGSEAAACPVQLVLDFSDIDPIPLVSVLFPLVIKHLSIPESSFRSLLQFPRVAIFQPSEPTSSGWLLGQLESLSIGFGTIESQEELIAMLRGQYEEATSGNETESRCPVSLKSVELRGRSRAEGLVEKIRGILGEVNVFWDSE